MTSLSHFLLTSGKRIPNLVNLIQLDSETGLSIYQLLSVQTKVYCFRSKLQFSPLSNCLNLYSH